MDLKNETDLGIGLVRNDDYVGLYFNLTAWNIKKPSNVIQLSLRKGSEMISISLILYYRGDNLVGKWLCRRSIMCPEMLFSRGFELRKFLCF